MSPHEEKNYFRRKYPRRTLRKKVGVLFDGQYFICDSGEIGEGGMSIISEYALTEGRELVLSFQIPDGTFVILRGMIKSVATAGDKAIHGIAFDQIPLAFKRQIRAFVSARTTATRIN
ncbi:PilZ domain-containing protein [Bdellovibrio sp. HCB337]|uniref:PilZ domain-containing protein n=1 Tax=Bdellovibrio sp. HCB337 TaxID=3394358 RepID=UPI0039A420E2